MGKFKFSFDREDNIVVTDGRTRFVAKDYFIQQPAGDLLGEPFPLTFGDIGRAIADAANLSAAVKRRNKKRKVAQ